MLVFAITGLSNTGKTTLIVELIEHFVREGKSVGAIKHTHHELNDEDRGDTARFQAAGANPVMLVGDVDPDDLPSRFTTDVLIIEGFKNRGPWMRFEAPLTLQEVLDRIGRP